MTTSLVFGALKLVGKMAPRCVGEGFPTFAPEEGIDAVEHGGQAYFFDVEMPKKELKKSVTAGSEEIGIEVSRDQVPTVTDE